MSPHDPLMVPTYHYMIFHWYFIIFSFLQTISWPYPINNIKIISYYNILFSYYIIIISILYPNIYPDHIQIIPDQSQRQWLPFDALLLQCCGAQWTKCWLKTYWRQSEDIRRQLGIDWNLLKFIGVIVDIIFWDKIGTRVSFFGTRMSIFGTMMLYYFSIILISFE